MQDCERLDPRQRELQRCKIDFRGEKREGDKEKERILVELFQSLPVPGSGVSRDKGVANLDIQEGCNEGDSMKEENGRVKRQGNLTVFIEEFTEPNAPSDIRIYSNINPEK